MRWTRIVKRCFTALTLLVVLACTLFAPGPAWTPPTMPPTFIMLPPAVLPTEQIVLSSVSVSEDSQSPNYQVKAQIPTLQGSSAAPVVNFNTAMTNLVNAEIDAFKKGMAELPADTATPRSSFDGSYTLVFQKDEIWSFKFDFAFYASGAAHPGHYSLTVNYDLAQGRQLVLSEVFLPNSDYLTAIADYCAAELSQRDIAFDTFSEGADPTAGNYRNWNIASDGLIITFDEYQIAPYAAGPQMVVVPYSVLEPLIDPQGPLRKVNQ